MTENFLLAIYQLLPGWAVGGTLVFAGMIWLMLGYYVRQRRIVCPNSWATTSLIGGAFILLASFWIFTPGMVDVPIEAKAGLSRLLVMVLAIALWAHAISLLRQVRRDA